jgi:outer membrane biosynthesis protein TonB
MKVPTKCVAWLLPLLLTGCFHWPHRKQAQQPVAPPIETASLPEPSTAPATPPPPVVSEPQPNPPEPAPSTTPAQSTPKPAPVHHKKPPVKPTEPAKSTEQTKNTEQPKNTEQASNGDLGVSAIGELSSGSASDYRRQTEDSIAATERSLNAITRTLNDGEQKTAAHIRDDLKEARAALASGDVDGAHTLAAKAKVLLAELTK